MTGHRASIGATGVLLGWFIVAREMSCETLMWTSSAFLSDCSLPSSLTKSLICDTECASLRESSIF